jgi:hypothetical protein
MFQHTNSPDAFCCRCIWVARKSLQKTDLRRSLSGRGLEVYSGHSRTHQLEIGGHSFDQQHDEKGPTNDNNWQKQSKGSTGRSNHGGRPHNKFFPAPYCKKSMIRTVFQRETKPLDLVKDKTLPVPSGVTNL